MEEEKGVEGAAGGRPGAGGVVSSAQLLDAVNDILGRADLSLSMEQGQRLKEGIRQKGEDLIFFVVYGFWVVVRG